MISAMSVPSVFKVFIGGYTGESFGVRLDGGQLWYEPFDYGYIAKLPVDVTPSIEDWQHFWGAADAIGLWDWSDEYQPEALICDGTNWSIEITNGDRRVKSGGSNAFPPNFDRWCQIVSQLIGGREFS